MPSLPEPQTDAAEAMAARLHGDPQAPAVVRNAPREAAAAAELAARGLPAPAARRREGVRYRAPCRQFHIEHSRVAGLSPEQIAEGEEKLRRIQAKPDQLQS